MATLMAPFTPFFAEFLYQRLRPRLPAFRDKKNRSADEVGSADSIHYVMLPQRVVTQTTSPDEEAVLVGMRLLQRAVELGRRAREDAKITMKTPVKSVVVVSTDAVSLDALRCLEPYLLGELNSWSVVLTTDVDAWCGLTALPNLPVLGKRLGKRNSQAAAAIKAVDSQSLRNLLAASQDAQSKVGDDDRNPPTLELDLKESGDKITVGLHELLIMSTFSGDTDVYAAQTTPDGSLTVAIEKTQDDALRAQGVTREVINR